MEYRKEIDGLRAIAVVPVLLFHADFRAFAGGFVGVDIFFVISGYLITRLILTDIRRNTFSLWSFYERRARRILPALFMVVLSCLPFAWVLMYPHQLQEFSQSLVAVVVFASNVLFWKQSDYFDADAALKPLLHTWSLAVEEQYYVFFPLLLLVLSRMRKSGLPIVLSIIAVASLTAAQFGSEYSPAATFFLLPTRAWELLIGSFGAFLFGRYSNIGPSDTAKNVLSGLGITCIVVSIFAFDIKTPFPSLYALLPTGGALLIILFSGGRTLVGKVLSSPPFVGIGLISYSLYLWHQPILAFLKIYNDGHELQGAQYAFYLGASVSLAYLSFRFVERPFRTRALSTKTLLISTSTCSLLVLLVGLQGHASKGFLGVKLAGVPVATKSILVDTQLLRRSSESALDSYYATLHRQTFRPDASHRIMFIGDSMARDVATSLARNASKFPGFDFELADLSHDCLYLTALLSSDCNGGLKSIKTTPLVKVATLVVVSFLWREDEDVASIRKLLIALKAANPNIIVLGSTGSLDMASISYKLAITNKELSQADIDRAVFSSRRPAFERGNLMIQKLAQDLGLIYFDRKRLYCDDSRKTCRILSLDGESLIWDNAHLTPYGMDVTAEKLLISGLFQ